MRGPTYSACAADSRGVAFQTVLKTPLKDGPAPDSLGGIFLPMCRGVRRHKAQQWARIIPPVP